MSTVEFAPNNENELDDAVLNRLPVKKGRATGNNSRRSFGQILDSAINEIRQESDLKLAMKFQSQESSAYISKKYADEKIALQDKEYADMIRRNELEAQLCNRADSKCTPTRHTGMANDSKGFQADSKNCTDKYALSPEEEKACTPFYCGESDDDGFLDDDRLHALDDARMAAAMQIAEQKEVHKQRIGELFDADYAKHIAGDDSFDSKICYTKYVDKKWENVESYLDDVEGGICISLLLPDLDTYDVSIFESHSIQVDAVRKPRDSEMNDESAPVEYKADYSFEGATKGICLEMIQHEFIKQSGILFIFVEKLKLRGPSSQCYISPSKSNDPGSIVEKPRLANSEEPNHYISRNKTENAVKAKNSFMLRVKKSTLGRILSFNK